MLVFQKGVPSLWNEGAITISIVSGRYVRFICNFVKEVVCLTAWSTTSCFGKSMSRDPNKCNIAVDCVENEGREMDSLYKRVGAERVVE